MLLETMKESRRTKGSGLYIREEGETAVKVEVYKSGELMCESVESY